MTPHIRKHAPVLLACGTNGWNFGAPTCATGRMTALCWLAARGHRMRDGLCEVNGRGLLHSMPACRRPSVFTVARGL